MNILITTFGTRGDIQPFIALGKGLKAAGYTSPSARRKAISRMSRRMDLDYLFMDNELRRLSQAALDKTDGIGDSLGILSQMLPAIKRSMDDEWRAALRFQPDLIVYHPKCLGSYHVAEKLRHPGHVIAAAAVLYADARLSRAVHVERRTRRRVQPFLLSPDGACPAMYTAGRSTTFAPKHLGLPRARRFATADARSMAARAGLVSLQPASAPVPADFPPHVHVTGYWFLDHAPDWQPPPGIGAISGSGTPPVYIGFGSMGARKGEKRDPHGPRGAREIRSARPAG